MIVSPNDVHVSLGCRAIVKVRRPWRYPTTSIRRVRRFPTSYWQVEHSDMIPATWKPLASPLIDVDSSKLDLSKELANEYSNAFDGLIDSTDLQMTATEFVSAHSRCLPVAHVAFPSCSTEPTCLLIHTFVMIHFTWRTNNTETLFNSMLKLHILFFNTRKINGDDHEHLNQSSFVQSLRILTVFFLSHWYLTSECWCCCYAWTKNSYRLNSSVLLFSSFSFVFFFFRCTMYEIAYGQIRTTRKLCFLPVPRMPTENSIILLSEEIHKKKPEI